jgi:NADH-quinone oxidoreductase subunit G
MSEVVATKQSVSFILDGKEVTGYRGETIIQVADREGVYIPRFCYHERLSVAANCRMCLVQVNDGKKTLPACHAQISQDMVVNTQSSTTRQSQQSVMEFLLINHPLDCPICDQGGQCDLQDLAMGFGKGVSRYEDTKRVVKDEDLGPLVSADMTRCIHCTRCVRFGTEISGIPDLGALGRGEDMRILSYLKTGLNSEVSGNVIDLCPVGALTSKPHRYRGRSWSFTNHAYYSAHDCLQSHVYVHTYKNGIDGQDAVMRVVPRQCDSINQIWLSDRDRFSYLGLQHRDRLTHPMIRDGKSWRVVDWETALTLVSEKIQSVIKDHGPEQIGALISPSTSLEEGFIGQKLLHTLGCRNMDYRLHQRDTDYMDSAVHTLPQEFLSFEQLDNSQCVVLVGSYIRHEQPIAGLRLRAASLKGTRVLSINPIAHAWNFHCEEEAVVAGQDFVQFLGACVVSLANFGAIELSDRWRERLIHIDSSTQSDRFAKYLMQSDGYLLLGQYAQSHPHASAIYKLCSLISSVTQMRLVMMTPGTNSTGLHAIGYGPCHRVDSVNMSTGESSYQMIDRPKQLYLLQQVEPEIDHYDPALARAALTRAQTVVAITSFTSPEMLEYADILLPAAAWTEFSGSWVNITGEINTFQAIKPLHGQSKSAWKIYRVLANLLKCEGFTYHDISELRADIPLLSSGCLDESIDGEVDLSPPLPRQLADQVVGSELTRIGELGHYQMDTLVRRCDPLQRPADKVIAKIHPDTVRRLGFDDLGNDVVVSLKQGQNVISCPLLTDKTIAKGAVYCPVICHGDSQLSGRNDAIEILFSEDDQ